MARSPIETMIDRACGFDQSAPRPVRDLVILRCPICKKEKKVDRHKSDPPGCTVVETACPDCSRSGDFEIVDYFNAAGAQIDCDGKVI